TSRSRGAIVAASAGVAGLHPIEVFRLGCRRHVIIGSPDDTGLEQVRAAGVVDGASIHVVFVGAGGRIPRKRDRAALVVRGGDGRGGVGWQRKISALQLGGQDRIHAGFNNRGGSRVGGDKADAHGAARRHLITHDDRIGAPCRGGRRVVAHKGPVGAGRIGG